MSNEEIKKYIRALVNFFNHKFKLHKTPNIKFDNTPQKGNPLLQKTAYYDPDEQKITVFTHERHFKDYMRSLAHELVHFKQDIKGELDGYEGDTLIGGNNKLIELEKEAYLKGNMIFREFTELVKNGKLKI